MSKPPLKIAIIGCGAIAETGHLPGALLAREIELTLLVDKNLERARALADRFGVARVTDDVETLPEFAEAAVIATQPGVHAPLAVPLLERGIHTLVEKPIAVSTAECDRMNAASKKSGAVYAAAMVRRFYPGDRFLKQVLDDRLLGEVESFRMDDGYPFAWPSATSFILSKGEAGGGVLMGLGSHVFDSMMWLLGDVDSFQYFSDARGGIEADCRVELEMECGATGIAEMSRTRLLDNRYVVHCEKGSIEVPYLSNEARILTRNGETAFSGTVGPAGKAAVPCPEFAQLMADQLDDFARAVRENSAPSAPGSEVRKSIALVEDCYANPQPYEMPWIQPIPIPGFQGASS